MRETEAETEREGESQRDRHIETDNIHTLQQRLSDTQKNRHSETCRQTDRQTDRDRQTCTFLCGNFRTLSGCQGRISHRLGRHSAGHRQEGGRLHMQFILSLIAGYRRMQKRFPNAILPLLFSSRAAHKPRATAISPRAVARWWSSCNWARSPFVLATGRDGER